MVSSLKFLTSRLSLASSLEVNRPFRPLIGLVLKPFWPFRAARAAALALFWSKACTAALAAARAFEDEDEHEIEDVDEADEEEEGDEGEPLLLCVCWLGPCASKSSFIDILFFFF